MDWRFGVTSSTSEIEQLGTTFLQMKLVIENETNLNQNNSNSLRSMVHMELDLPQFYSFLKEMQKANTNLQMLLN
ncbi:comm domain-containing protein [Anaeramoeba ignava]|uniref:Comm domain-containing protein n=1 Tax=Anaeramoeba ignava TaxID=1746090 RepID=A0A9Q0R5U0_ANAIG|nr:comm domain-containing protein [Anaeramoeba ignava]